MVATVEETPKRSNRVRWFVQGAILIGLIGLTVWNLTRANALHEAIASYPPANQDDIGALRLTLRRATDRLAPARRSQGGAVGGALLDQAAFRSPGGAIL